MVTKTLTFDQALSHNIKEFRLSLKWHIILL